MRSYTLSAAIALATLAALACGGVFDAVPPRGVTDSAGAIVDDAEAARPAKQ